jgi:hypothetical protein
MRLIPTANIIKIIYQLFKTMKNRMIGALLMLPLWLLLVFMFLDEPKLFIVMIGTIVISVSAFVGFMKFFETK